MIKVSKKNSQGNYHKFDLKDNQFKVWGFRNINKITGNFKNKLRFKLIFEEIKNKQGFINYNMSISYWKIRRACLRKRKKKNRKVWKSNNKKFKIIRSKLKIPTCQKYQNKSKVNINRICKLFRQRIRYQKQFRWKSCKIIMEVYRFLQMNLGNQQLTIRNHGEMQSRVNCNQEGHRILTKTPVHWVLIIKILTNHIYTITVIIPYQK